MIILGTEVDADGIRRRTGDTEALWGLRSVVLDGGVEHAVRVIEVRTAAGLEFDVLVDRAFDIGAARWRGVPFGWRSGVGFRHPGLAEEDEGGLAWLRGLDGLLVSAGLDHTLFGGEYDAGHYRYPPRRMIRHGLHGRLSTIPGRVLQAQEVWEGGRGVLRVVGEIVQSTVFGEHLRLTRTIEVDVDGVEIRLHDRVENLGFERTPHMFLYHINIGWPVVEEGTEFIADVDDTIWQSDSVREQGVPYGLLPGPSRGLVEQVFEHRLLPREGICRVALVRADRELGVEVAWDHAAMPHFFEWQNLREGQYAVGLEPSTHGIGGEDVARADGSMIWLEHAEGREYCTIIRILAGRHARLSAERVSQ
ncbi:DUF4432 family protein [Rathayibacter soli]|uniref:DUF4432 family protein n=1 Tax=Rathayibacter soli TaxID=3144168 RepID=UPI0027E4051C|nr:DUF4432 family protein [Glaciibacter superstes]